MNKFRITKKAFRLYHSYNPKYFPLRFLQILFTNLSPYFNLWMSAEIITALYEKRTEKELYLLVAVTLAGNFLIRAAGAVLEKMVSTALEILRNKEAEAFYHKTLSLDYNKLENPEIRNLRRKILENTWINGYGVEHMRWRVEGILSGLLNLAFAALLFAEMVSLIRTVSFQWLGIVLLAVSIISLLLSILASARREKKVSIYWDKIGETMLRENRIDGGYCSMGMDNRIYRQQDIISRDLDKFNKEHKDICLLTYKMEFLLSIPAVYFSKLSELCSYLLVCFYCLLGAFPVGSVIKYIGYLGKLSESIEDLSFCINALKSNEPFLETYLKYFDVKNDMYQGSLSVEKRSDKKFDIEFKNVSFCYDAKNMEEQGANSQEEKPLQTDNDLENNKILQEERTPRTDNDLENNKILQEERTPQTDNDLENKNSSKDNKNYALKNINLNLKVGERLAVVGMNGSGKTTFIKLLCRLYDPTEGEIIMNDFNIRKYDYRQYLDLFSVVFQDYNLLAVPLGNNIASAADYDAAKAEKLLEEVGFGERYAEMPKGLETPLYKYFDEDGVNISGGEAQKIALARALYKDAPFIILDEPTAALDPIAEAEIYARFDDIVGDKTAIYISHRLSSCRFCDKIAVFDAGRIVQVGTHEELLADKNGKYYELWNAQAQYYA